MKDYSVFDILGPVMIGPSSSHTAGAARLGKVSTQIARPGFKRVTFYLHGSFATTYRGHGTDRALVAGVLGMEPDDENLVDSLSIAKEKGLDINFKPSDLGYVHPNTVKIVFEYESGNPETIIGSSIGGGNITIININGNEIQFTGQYPTLLIQYEDTKGFISRISSIISDHDINIATMKVSREDRIATMILETDNGFPKNMLEYIETLSPVTNMISINTRNTRGGDSNVQ